VINPLEKYRYSQRQRLIYGFFVLNPRHWNKFFDRELIHSLEFQFNFCLVYYSLIISHIPVCQQDEEKWSFIVRQNCCFFDLVDILFALEKEETNLKALKNTISEGKSFV